MLRGTVQNHGTDLHKIFFNIIHDTLFNRVTEITMQRYVFRKRFRTN
jgi:hypothetical protein